MAEECAKDVAEWAESDAMSAPARKPSTHPHRAHARLADAHLPVGPSAARPRPCRACGHAVPHGLRAPLRC